MLFFLLLLNLATTSTLSLLLLHFFFKMNYMIFSVNIYSFSLWKKIFAWQSLISSHFLLFISELLQVFSVYFSFFQDGNFLWLWNLFLWLAFEFRLFTLWLVWLHFMLKPSIERAYFNSWIVLPGLWFM